MGLSQLPQADEIIQQPTEPPTPYTGMLWLDTDEDAASPVGVLGYAEVTADQGSITTVTDLTNLTVQVNVPAGHRIRVQGVIRASNTGANSNLLYIREGSTTLNTGSYVASTSTESVVAEAILSPSAGAHTYKLTADTGGGTMTMRASSTAPAFILVEDLGPVIPTLTATGSLLATAYLRHASVNTTVSTTSTTAVEIDSTNLSVTFKAPASGAVIVGLTAYGTANNIAYGHIWSLRDSTPADVPLSSQTLINSTGGTLGTYRMRFTGLTPGNTYTWRWAWRATSAGTINVFHGPANGALQMEVWSA